MVKHSAKKSKNRENSVFFFNNATIQSSKNPDGFGNGSKLHKGTKLHEDNFASRVYSARVTVLHGGSFFHEGKKKIYSPRVMVMGISDSRNKNKKVTYKINF